MTLSECLTDLCKELNNWFDRGRRCFGTFAISDGALSGFDGALKAGQYYRIIGSVFNDGAHRYGDTDGALTDETFDGAVWPMFVTSDVLRLAADISAWRELYEAADSPALLPFAMESWGGYMYQTRGGANVSGGGTVTWQSVFADRLDAYRKY